MFINYIPFTDLMVNNLITGNWFNLIQLSNYSNTIQCTQCEGSCETVSYSSDMSDILFIEFCPAAMIIARYSFEINVLWHAYQLVAMVRHLGSHLSCVVDIGKWTIIDDLQDLCVTYESLDDLYEASYSGWFCAVYKKKCLVQNPKFDCNYFREKNVSGISNQTEVPNAKYDIQGALALDNLITANRKRDKTVEMSKVYSEDVKIKNTEDVNQFEERKHKVQKV